MSTDRELLELAAKAAGIEHGGYGEMIGGAPYLAARKQPLGMWAPLTDDGDALRLAVKLKLDITFYGCDSVGAQAGHLIPDIQGDFVALDDGLDDFSATRRCIVRAAAEIGRPQ